MTYVPKFEEAMRKLNERAKTDPKIKKSLGDYKGRTLVLEVYGDATYVFSVSESGVSFEVNPAKLPDDMYAGMDRERAYKLIHKREVSKSDVIFGKIKRKNIKIEDVKFVKDLFEDVQKQS